MDFPKFILDIKMVDFGFCILKTKSGKKNSKIYCLGESEREGGNVFLTKRDGIFKNIFLYFFNAYFITY